MKTQAKRVKATPKDARDALWRLGELSWKLEPAQKQLYNFIKKKDDKIIVVNSSRRIGKSTICALIAIEECLKNPNYIVKFVAPTKDQVKNILLPTFKTLFNDAPEDLKYGSKVVYSPSESRFKFPNGSEIQLAGCDNGHYNSLRGGFAHWCFIDEAGFVSQLEEVLMSVLLPTTTTTRGRIVVASTPPEDGDHYFKDLMETADMKNNLFVMTIEDYFKEMERVGAPCKRIPKDEIDNIMFNYGGRHSLKYRREYLCELISAAENLVIPEFTPEIQKEIIREWERPDYCDIYTAMDIGVRDLTVVLFAYYDFRNNKVIIEDELVLSESEMTTDKVADGIKAKEEALWHDKLTNTIRKPTLRVSDNNLLLIQDLIRLHDLTFIPTEKKDKLVHINDVRLKISSQQVIINPRCETLIKHLKYAQWNKQRNDFKRTRDSGHADAVMALVYLLRNIQWSKNPYPKDYEYNSMNSGQLFVSPKYSKSQNDFKEALRAMFQPKSTLRK